jgi:hypothetical protein
VEPNSQQCREDSSKSNQEHCRPSISSYRIKRPCHRKTGLTMEVEAVMAIVSVSTMTVLDNRISIELVQLVIDILVLCLSVCLTWTSLY